MADAGERLTNWVIVLITLGLAFSGTVISILFAVYVWGSEGFHNSRRWDQRLCGQILIMDEVYCKAIQDMERRQIGAAVTNCPLAERWTQLYECPDPQQRTDTPAN